MPSKLYYATEDFEEALRTCGKSLAACTRVDAITRARVADTGEDMLAWRENFVRAHIHASMWTVDETDEAGRWRSNNTREAMENSLRDMIRRGNSAVSAREKEAKRELKVAYKAYFFFIRAFQDSCYNALLSLNGERPSNRSSMSKGVSKTSGPMYDVLQGVTGYVAWFTGFKEKRDRIKVGVNLSLCGPQWDVGIGLTRQTSDGRLIVNASEQGDKVRISDIAEAFQFSTSLLRAIQSKAQDLSP